MLKPKDIGDKTSIFCRGLALIRGGNTSQRVRFPQPYRHWKMDNPSTSNV